MKRSQATSDRLDAAAIGAALGERRGELAVEVVDRCTSTNALLLERGPGERAALLAAEAQTAGRGRRGRRWHSARGVGLTFSLARLIRRPLGELPGLSLVAGVAVARVLRGLGAAELALKWPNDLVARGAKLGGILVETRSVAGGTWAVIGIGINLSATPDLGTRLRRQVVALQQLVDPLPARNALLAALGGALLDALREFEAAGLASLRADWEALHAHAGQRIRVRLANGRVLSGLATGLAVDGALQLRTRRGLRDIHSARVVAARAVNAPGTPRRAA
ncbi:MAG: biotin--[acetyl-CoA-carboxylase] ligase [Betaproteobacteria bacterium]|nr:MAG: biotin--[acetyl-CoA-carboxylase] ligase [Betaproteobacteria bacterium]